MAVWAVWGPEDEARSLEAEACALLQPRQSRPDPSLDSSRFDLSGATASAFEKEGSDLKRFEDSFLKCSEMKAIIWP